MKVMVLIDYGALHNFILYKVVEALMLVTPQFWVKLGDEYKVKAKGVWQGLCVQLQGLPVQLNFDSFSLIILYFEVVFYFVQICNYRFFTLSAR